jgi:hypothetical protein
MIMMMMMMMIIIIIIIIIIINCYKILELLDIYLIVTFISRLMHPNLDDVDIKICVI